MENMTSESQSKIDLKTFYKNLPRAVAPKTDFVERVALQCNVNEQTVRTWVAGTNKPSDPAYIEILVKETGIAAENLFEK